MKHIMGVLLVIITLTMRSVTPSASVSFHLTLWRYVNFIIIISSSIIIIQFDGTSGEVGKS